MSNELKTRFGDSSPTHKLAYIWARMVSRYGAVWGNSHGDAPSRIDQAEWGKILADLTEDDIRRGFGVDLNRASDFPPSSAKFREMCLPPVSDAPRTYLGSTPRKREFTAIESERSRVVADRELGALCKKLGIDRDNLTKSRP